MKFRNKAYELLIEPRSTNDEWRRRESILNVLLAGMFALTFVASVMVFFSSFQVDFAGEPPLVALAQVLLVAALWYISRIGYYRFSAYFLVLLFLVLGLGSLYLWGISLPQGVLAFALVLTMSSVLLGTGVAVVLTTFSSGALIAIGALQEMHVIKFNSDWMAQPGGLGDAIGYAFTLGIIVTVSWLSNREIERALNRARKSEAELIEERDMLEVKVKERTKELEQTQREKIMEMTRFAEFGKLTSGIVHELVSPLTAISLNLEQMHDEKQSGLLKRAVDSTKRMERYIQSARKQLLNQSVTTEFSLAHEIQASIDFLEPQARHNEVQLVFHKRGSARLVGNPIKFHQLVTNLMSNAISAYGGKTEGSERRIEVSLSDLKTHIVISVQDWGSGIPAEHIQKIFDPFFSLKKADQGMGIGLSLSKEIVEDEFGGTISVMSEQDVGTAFMVKLPHKHERHGRAKT